MFNPVLNCSHTCVKRVYKQHEQINCLQLLPKIMLQYDTVKHDTKKRLRQILKYIFRQSLLFSRNMKLVKKTHTFPICDNYNILYNKPTRCNSGSLCLLKTTSMLYMFRTPFASIFRSTINCNSSHWCLS